MRTSPPPPLALDPSGHILFDRSLLLAGAFVQRADLGARGAVVKVRAPGETTYIVLVPQGLALTEERPPAPTDARRRKELEGARVLWLSGRRLSLLVSPGKGGKGGAPRFVQLSLHGGGDATRLVLEPYEGEPAVPKEALEIVARASLLSGSAQLRETLVADALATRKAAASRAVKRAAVRLERRVVAIQGDLARIEVAAAVAAQAPWFIAAASTAPRGARELTVTDWSSGEPLPLTIALDPAKPARSQVDAMFARARRLKLGGAVALERQAKARAALDTLHQVLAAIDGAGSLPDVDRALSDARAAAPRDVSIALEPPAGSSRARGPSGQAKLPPFRTFTSASGRTILVGKGAAQNDLLTFHVAKPGDLWLHAKARNGAHVIVPRANRRDLAEATSPREARDPSGLAGDLLVEAAHLAAHFSDARDETLVDVQYTERRYLRKPRGSVAGLVVVQREKVLPLRVEGARLAELLAREVLVTG